MVNNNSNSNSSNNNNNKQCQICLEKKNNSNARCFFTCKGKTCNKCINKVRKSGNPSCPTCRKNIRQHPLPRPNAPNPRTINYSVSRMYAQAAADQRAVANGAGNSRAMQRIRNSRPNGSFGYLREGRGAFQEPPPARAPLINRMYQRSGSTSPPPRVNIPNNNNRGRRSGSPSPEPRQMHTGGLVRKTGPHRLLKDEIVLSRAQRKGFTHGQIVKILKSYKKSK